MMRRAFTKRELVLILILAVLLLVSVYYLLIWQPTVQAMDEAYLRYEAAENQIVNEKVKAAQLDNMRTKLAELNESGERKEVARYDNVHNVVTLLNEALAPATTFQISFRPVEIEGQIVSRAVDMYYTCDGFRGAQSILETLRNSPYRCELTSVSFHAEEVRSGDIFADAVSVRLTVVFFEYTDAVQEPAEESN